MANHKVKFNSLYKRLDALQKAYPGRPIVSVGSGVGEWEKRLEAKGLSVICVDPAPNSFDDRKVFKNPDYASTAALIAARPTIVGDCIVLLIWAAPNDSHYDIDAVHDLKPRAVVAIYASDGAAGGNQFRCWVASLGGPTVLKGEMEENKHNNPDGYQIGACLELRYWRMILGDRDIRNDCLVVLFTGDEETCQKFLVTFGREMYGDAREVDLDTAVTECLKKKINGMGLLKMLLADAAIRAKSLNGS